MKAAWEQCLDGSGVTIAIVDDGLYERNPDIYLNYVSVPETNIHHKISEVFNTVSAIYTDSI